MKAVKRFDPERGVRLVSFAVHWIKAEIHEYIIRNWRLVKVATTKAQRKLFFNLRSMRPDGHTLDTEQVDHIARELNVRREDVSEMEVRLSGRDLSLENQDDDDDSYAPIAYLSDECREEPTRVLERKARDDLQGKGLSDASWRWIRVRGASSRPAGCRTTAAPRCMSWPPSSASRPSASARSRPPR